MFILFNNNPKPRKTTEDCVIRAIAKAYGQPWEWALLALYETSLRETFDSPTSKRTFERLLKMRGAEKLRQICDALTGGRITVRQFSRLFSSGRYIVTTQGHMTCVIDGDIYDIWDCSESKVMSAWRIR